MQSLEIQGNTLQERKDWLKSVLSESVCEVTFTKVDGTVRNMPCTLQSSVLPPLPESTNKRMRHYPETLSVWCTDQNEWRSFRVMNVTEVKVP